MSDEHENSEAAENDREDRFNHDDGAEGTLDKPRADDEGDESVPDA
jgi:hypothetical protein